MLYTKFHQLDSSSEQHIPMELRPLPWSTMNDVVESVFLSYQNTYNICKIYAYFPINVNYIVSIGTINDFKWIDLYF